VHTFFMRFPIDIVRVDDAGKVVGVEVAMKPWRMLMPSRSTKHMIELKAGRAKVLGIGPGTALQIEGMWS